MNETAPAILDRACEIFCDDVDVLDSLDGFVRGHISPLFLIERLTFLKQIALDRAEDRIDRIKEESRNHREYEPGESA